MVKIIPKFNVTLTNVLLNYIWCLVGIKINLKGVMIYKY